MIRSWVFVFAVLLLDLWLFLLCESTVGLAVLIAIFVLCIFSAVINRAVMPKITVKAELPQSCGKAKEVSGILKIKNARHIAYRCLKAELCIKNALTGEEQTQTLKAALYPKSSAEIEISFKVRYCGDVSITLKNARLYDFFGLTNKTINIATAFNITVLPELLPVSLSAVSPFDSGDAQSYSNDRIGNDITELFALREYTNGDSIRSIQWKLSAKHDKLIVKLGSEPNDTRLCLCMLTHLCKEPPVLSTMAELLCSLSLSLCEKNILHEIFADDCYYTVSNEQDLSAVLSKILVKNSALPEDNDSAPLIVCIAPNNEELQENNGNIVFIPAPKNSDLIQNIEI